MKMVTHDRCKSDIDHEVGRQQLQTIHEPLASMVVITTGDGIDAQQKCLANTLAEYMEDSRLSLADDLSACAPRHGRCPLY